MYVLLADGGSGNGKTSCAASCVVEHNTKIARMAMMIVVRVFICLSPFICSIIFYIVNALVATDDVLALSAATNY